MVKLDRFRRNERLGSESDYDRMDCVLVLVFVGLCSDCESYH